MRLLALETATPAGAVALRAEGRTLGEIVTTTSREHTETLLPGALELLTAAGLALSALDAIVVDVGPGLFTGLRVGVSTARSLAMAIGIGVIAVTSLEVLAADPALGDAPEVLAVVDARRGEVFAQRFSGRGPERRAVADAAVLLPERLATLLEPSSSGPVLAVGDGAIRYREQLEALDRLEVVGSVTLPSPAVAAALAEERGRQPLAPASVMPLYLRDPDAVANFHVAPAGPGR
jgi:tRNA threonylcarbamoyladenosine biosynthesis protein TsaB